MNSSIKSNAILRNAKCCTMCFLIIHCLAVTVQAQALPKTVLHHWQNKQYRETLQGLLEYRKRNKETAGLAMMIAVCRCYIPGMEEQGVHSSKWVLIRYGHKLDSSQRSTVIEAMFSALEEQEKRRAGVSGTPGEQGLIRPGDCPPPPPCPPCHTCPKSTNDPQEQQESQLEQLGEIHLGQSIEQKGND